MRSVRATKEGQKQVESHASAYAADDLGLTFYKEPPATEMSVREFEELVLDRLKVLHAIDRQLGYDTHLASLTEKRGLFTKDLGESRLRLAYPNSSTAGSFSAQKAEFRRRDATSHFVLRFAFCASRDAREWLLRQEQRLFVLRFEMLNPEAQEAFLRESALACKKFVPGGEGKPTLEQLQKTTPGAKLWSRDGSKGAPLPDPNFYEMPFYEVHPSLIAHRKVYLQGGTAYVPSGALKLILAGKFKENLNAGLDLAYQGLPTALADPRVGHFLRILQDHGMQLLVANKPKGDGEDVGEKLSLENFEELMARSFPPCMRRLVEYQREQKKHLKHAGRLQLRPFLKECGFTMEESFRWWKQELCRDPEIDATVYEKNYTYDVEHTYGKKGHLQGQNSFGCPKVIGFPGEAVGQAHGCPFKQLDAPALKHQLHRWRIPETSANEIEKLVTNGKHFQLACVEYFRAKHAGHEGDGVGNSPADFFKESCRCHKPKEAATPAAGGTSPPKGSPQRAAA